MKEWKKKKTHSKMNVGRDLYSLLLLHSGDLVKLGETQDELQMRIHI